MAEIVNIVEITKLSYGTVETDGSMATSLTQIYGIKEGTATLNIGEPATTDIRIEESNVAFTTVVGARDADLTVEMIGVEAADIADVLGGTYAAAGAAGATITFSPTPDTVEMAILLEGLNSDGVVITFSIPKAKVIASFSGTVGRGQARGWTIKFKILVPLDESSLPCDWLIVTLGEGSGS